MRPLIVLLLFALPALAAPVPKALKKPSSPDGAWHLVAVNSDGKKGSVENMGRYWLVRGETVTLGRPHTDPDRQPPQVCELTIPDPTRPHLRRFGAESQFLSVLEVEGDILRFCYAYDGRKELTECKPDKGIAYYVFERVKE